MTKKDFMVKYDMVDLLEDDCFVKEIVYATDKNFTNQVVYPKAYCMLRREVAESLIRASHIFNEVGIIMKIWDAFRPVKCQELFWKIYPDSRFVTNPVEGKSIHCTGGAIDVTLCDKTTLEELEMPTTFDFFGEEATRAYYRAGLASQKACRNAKLLEEVLHDFGFEAYEFEWWHFNYRKRYAMVEEMYDVE